MTFTGPWVQIPSPPLTGAMAPAVSPPQRWPTLKTDRLARSIRPDKGRNTSERRRSRPRPRPTLPPRWPSNNASYRVRLCPELPPPRWRQLRPRAPGHRRPARPHEPRDPRLGPAEAADPHFQVTWTRLPRRRPAPAPPSPITSRPLPAPSMPSSSRPPPRTSQRRRRRPRRPARVRRRLADHQRHADGIRHGRAHHGMPHR